MPSDLRFLTPEEEELARKRAELDELQSELVQRELDLATMMADLQAFERRYMRVVGARLAELDGLEAEVADLLAHRAAHDHRLRRRLAEANARARRSAAAQSGVPAGGPDCDGAGETFQPPAELRMLFHDLAKRIHPDLSETDAERPRRTRLMAEANAAYQRGDLTRLTHILAEWQSTPETVKGEGTGVDLVRTIRRLAQVRRRLAAIQGELTDLAASELYGLKIEVERAAAGGEDVLVEMAAELDDRAHVVRHRLAALLREQAYDGTHVGW
jgi:hypothetical protein